MWNLHTFIALICLLLCGKSECNKQTYTLSLEEMTFETINGRQVVDPSNVLIMGPNRLINGTVELLEDIDAEHYTIHVALYTDTSGNGEYRPLPYNISTTDPCTALKDYGSYAMPSLKQDVNTNFPILGDTCPIPKGTYFFNDIALEPDNLPAQIPRGFLKGVLTLFQNNEAIGTVVMVARVEDKYSM